MMVSHICNSSSKIARSARYLFRSASNECFYGVYRSCVITEWFFRRAYGSDHIAVLSVLRFGSIAVASDVLFTSRPVASVQGGGSIARATDSMAKKIVSHEFNLTRFATFAA